MHKWQKLGFNSSKSVIREMREKSCIKKFSTIYHRQSFKFLVQMNLETKLWSQQQSSKMNSFIFLCVCFLASSSFWLQVAGKRKSNHGLFVHFQSLMTNSRLKIERKQQAICGFSGNFQKDVKDLRFKFFNRRILASAHNISWMILFGGYIRV